MSDNKINYKIKKYIFKLKNVSSLDKATLYQKKIRYYRRYKNKIQLDGDVKIINNKYTESDLYTEDTDDFCN